MITPERALAWLVEDACPLWLEHGVDWRGGGFQEELDPASLAPRSDFRRLRVAARQVYVFAQAARLGVPRAAEAVELGLDFLRTHARHAGGGYAMRFDTTNAVIDPSLDLYDHAFVLLAFAHAGQHADARDVLATIDEDLAHPDFGWHESHPPALPRRQNPHMHLFEAMLAAGELLGDTSCLDRADTVVDILLDRFLQPDCDGLPEYYDEGLVAHRDNGRYVWEPGHHVEWVWLLDEHRRISAAAGRPARDTRQAAARLQGFAERHGVLEGGIMPLEMWSDGGIKTRATRVWPHTERIKALSRTGGDIGPALDTLWRFFDDVPAGLWRERWDGDFIGGDVVPASTLYHIACAVIEIQPDAAWRTR